MNNMAPVADNITTTLLVPTTYGTTTTDPNAFTAHEMRKQRLFSTLVITCFFSFLFFVIGYVTFMHVKRIRQIQRDKAELEEEEEDKPKINRRTSVMGQGQKQVVIERKASVMSNHRKQSVCSPYGGQGPQLNTKLLRQPTWLSQPPQMPPPQNPLPMGVKNDVRGGDFSTKNEVFLPNLQPTATPSRMQNNFSFPATYPMNTYLENVLIRYRDDSFTTEPCEKSTSEENESGLSSSESILEGKKEESIEEVEGEDDDVMIDERQEKESLSTSYGFAREDTRLLAP